MGFPKIKFVSGKDKKKDENLIEIEETTVEAKEITLSPLKDGHAYQIAPNTLKSFLKNRVGVVWKDVIIDAQMGAKRRDGNDSQFFDDFFGEDFTALFSPILENLVVLETKPKGKVRITYDTKINFLDHHPDSPDYADGIRISNIIEVKNRPNLKELTEVSDLDEIKKIVNVGNFVSKYEDGKQVIYFVGKYYFVKKK